MRVLIISLLGILLLSACGSRSVNVEYQPDAEASNRGDWYRVPTEAPVTVSSTDRVVERPPVRVTEPQDDRAATEGLKVTESVDSFGNTSLDVNRGASLTWELLNVAVSQLEWPVADRDRSEYRLELEDRERSARGFFGRLKGFFTEDSQRVSLILVPKVGATGISAEYPEDKALGTEDNRRLMMQLRDELLQGQ